MCTCHRVRVNHWWRGKEREMKKDAGQREGERVEACGGVDLTG